MTGGAAPPSPSASTIPRPASPHPPADCSKQSDSVQDVQAQDRSGMSVDPHIRGYKWGQIYADVDGAYWQPARLDMDTMLSKIDPGMIGRINVLSGPYGLRYGPGFAFIDIDILPTPRHNCYETDLDTIADVHGNGGQTYLRETVSGGGSNWGFRASYADRMGSDYRAGDGTLIPGNYHSTDEWAQFGYDIDCHQHLELLYQRMDQTGVDNPGEFFDTNYLGSYGLRAGYVNDDPSALWSKLSASLWYNATDFNGDTTQGYNPSFDTMKFVNDSLNLYYNNIYGAVTPSLTSSNALQGGTEGHAYSMGGRSQATFGEKDCTQLNVGSDFRYLGQVIGEQYLIKQTLFNQYGNPVQQNNIPFDTNMPHAAHARSGPVRRVHTTGD